MDGKQHWEQVFLTKGPTELSWFQPEPMLSLRLLDAAGLRAGSWLIDVGGGDSRLVDHMVARGIECLTVLDISGEALRRARLPNAPVTWIEADVTGDWSVPLVDFWHDRAVFHFLTDATDRGRYVEHLKNTLKPSGQAIIATFALEGPPRCSGLPVVRYSPDGLAAEFGAAFSLEETSRETHPTPFGSTQEFWYSRLRRVT
jgi:SAM-dependent methyltransferase